MNKSLKKQSNKEETHRQATWLELFFDLVFVAVVGALTHELAHTHHQHISFEQLVRFLLAFVPLWWIWSTHTLFANRFEDNSTTQKSSTLLIMGLVILLSTCIHQNLYESFSEFIAIFIAIRIILATLYMIAAKKKLNKTIANKTAAKIAKRFAYGIFIGAGFYLVALLFDSKVKFYIFYIGLLVDMLMQVWTSSKTKDFLIHRKHLAERIGLLAIIMLGETIISIVGTLDRQSWDFFDGLAATAGFCLIGAIWWIYYGSLHRLEKAIKIKTGSVMMFSHLVFYIGLLFLANMVRHSIAEDLDQPTFALLSISGLTLFYIGKQIPYMYAFPPYRFGIIINSLVCIAITVASTFLPRIEYSLVGMTVGMLVYVQLNINWLISKWDVQKYLD